MSNRKFENGQYRVGTYAFRALWATLRPHTEIKCFFTRSKPSQQRLHFGGAVWR